MDVYNVSVNWNFEKKMWILRINQDQVENSSNLAQIIELNFSYRLLYPCLFWKKKSRNSWAILALTIDRFKKFARLGTSLLASDAIGSISTTTLGKRASDALAKLIYHFKDANPYYANSDYAQDYAIARIFSISESTLRGILMRGIRLSDRQKKVELGRKSALTKRIKHQTGIDDVFLMMILIIMGIEIFSQKNSFDLAMFKFSTKVSPFKFFSLFKLCLEFRGCPNISFGNEVYIVVHIIYLCEKPDSVDFSRKKHQIVLYKYVFAESNFCIFQIFFLLTSRWFSQKLKLDFVAFSCEKLQFCQVFQFVC